MGSIGEDPESIRKGENMKKLMIFFIAVMLTPSVSALTLEDFEGDFICACGCYKILEDCDCGLSSKMQNQIKQMISSGMGKKEITSSLQLEFGEEVLANPPKEGFFTSLWIYPLIVLGSGLAVVGILIKRRDSSWYGDPDDVINEEIDLEEIDLDEIHYQSR